MNAPVAQLDRASDYGSEGLGFESLRVYKFNCECKNENFLFYIFNFNNSQFKIFNYQLILCARSSTG